MTRLQKIEREIEALGPQDLARFRAWFAEYDAANWDAKIAADAAAGKLDTLADTALSAHRSGRTRPL
jgi:hypothetical protein